MAGSKEIYVGYRPQEGNRVIVENLVGFTRLGLKDTGIANEVSISPGRKASIISGRKIPNLRVIGGVVNALGVGTEELKDSRAIDSWLAGHLSIFNEPGEKIIEVLSLGARRELVGLFRVAKQWKEEVSRRGREFHLFEALTTGQKWELCFIIEELVGAGFTPMPQGST